MGKAGAAVGAVAFLRMKDTFCPNHFCGKHADPALVSDHLRFSRDEPIIMAYRLSFFLGYY